MSVPNWNLRQQRQDYQNTSFVVPMSADHGVTELTWENGQLGMHGVNRSAATTTTTACGGDTLESIVHQATCHQNYSLMNMAPQRQKNIHEEPNISNNTATPIIRGKEGQVQMLIPPNIDVVVKKRARMESQSDQCGRYLSNGRRMLHDFGEERSGCASAGATFCRDNSNKDATFGTWGSSFDSRSQSLMIKTTDFDDSSSHGCGMENNRDEDQETKGGSLGTCSARRTRAAAVHNQSERRRRDRINQKMKALQKLVPNANKTDKASMLDEVINYLKHLQSQVDQMVSTRTIVPQTQMMVNTLAMQQQMQMSLLASRMGLGMLDLNAMAMARVPPPPPPPPPRLQSHAASLGSSGSPFTQPGIPTPSINLAGATTNSGTATHGLNPFNHPYNAFLAQQAGNMDFYSKMAAMYRHDQANQARTNLLPNFSQGK